MQKFVTFIFVVSIVPYIVMLYILAKRKKNKKRMSRTLEPQLDRTLEPQPDEEIQEELKLKLRKRQFMTSREFEYFTALKRAVPECDFHAQVSMDAIIEPDVRYRNKEYYSLRGRYSQKRVDFVMQNPKTGEIYLLIELDDRSHQSEKDAIRDELTTAAGYQTLRITGSNSSPDYLRRLIFPD